MQGDFSRDTFDARHQFSRVLMQQGRVLLDADWNEQAAIHLHHLRTLAADLIGPHGGPGTGFKIRCRHGEGDDCDFTIGWGHYYVDGILVENPRPARCSPGDYAPPLTYGQQPAYPSAKGDDLVHGTDYLVYLDVWERHLTHLEVDHIREVALGGPDTATRAQVVWQVKIADESECHHLDDDTLSCEDLLHELIGEHGSCLRARARVAESSDDPCIIPPEARYRGAENQLYRVEIHEPGSAPTFKWSRDNGSIVFAIRDIDGSVVTLDTLGPDQRRSLREGDWVEVLDDERVLLGEPGVLARVDAVDRVAFAVILALAEGTSLPPFQSKRHPLLRRWDQGSAPIQVQPGKWIDLEDGVQIWFEPNGTYRTGDYWMIPARTAIGDILWPTEAKADGTLAPAALPPHGIVHHYAPLARIRFDDDDELDKCEDCRCVFEPRCPSHRLEDVYFPPRSEAMGKEMERIGIANAEVLSFRLEANAGLQVKVIGYAPSAEGGEMRGKQIAESLKSLYVHNDIDIGVIEAIGKLDDSMKRPPARQRVETRLVKPPAGGTSEQPPAAEEAGVAGLTRIAGVGPARAEKFLGAGRNTPADVAAMSVEEIKSLLDVTDTVAASIRDSARAKA
jgi:predicted flap endonuclease-1-like 5' DNA nuclease